APAAMRWSVSGLAGELPWFAACCASTPARIVAMRTASVSHDSTGWWVSAAIALRVGPSADGFVNGSGGTAHLQERGEQVVSLAAVELLVGESDHAKPLRLEHGEASGIALDGESVDTADDFDHQRVGGQEQVTGVAKDTGLDQRIGSCEGPARWLRV